MDADELIRESKAAYARQDWEALRRLYHPSAAIVSVVGVPPTILVGIWGMNFKNMPELNWALGYPLAWLGVIASGLVPLLWFKWRGWFD